MQQPDVPAKIAHALSTLAALVLLIAGASSAEPAPGYRYSFDWTSPNSATWMKYLKPLNGRADARGLEIGCFEGQSTLWFLEKVLTHPDARMACIDVFTDEIEANFDHNVKISGQADRVLKHKGYSQDVLRGLEYDSVDFVYIDGCHLASCALTDAVLSWDLLRPGGFMIFDDYLFGIDKAPSLRPKLAIDAFIEAFLDQIHVRQIGFQGSWRRNAIWTTRQGSATRSCTTPSGSSA
jgi:predicted O-methyltransferase YrrM